MPTETRPFFSADLLLMHPIELDQYVMLWFGIHYEALDFAFRKGQYADPIAQRAIVIGRTHTPFAANPYPMASQMVATVHYDTTTMTYLRVDYCGPHGHRSIDLQKMKL